MTRQGAVECLRWLVLAVVTLVLLLQLGAQLLPSNGSESSEPYSSDVTTHRTSVVRHIRRADAVASVHDSWRHSSRQEYGANELTKSCGQAIVPLDARCPRQLVVHYLRSAGFGHQFTELLFGMYAAHYLGLTFTYSPIEASVDHNDDYTSLVNILGLERFFVEGLGLARAEDLRALHARNASIFWQWIDASYSNKLQAHVSCSSVVTIEGWWHCTGVADNNCFWAPEHEFLFQRYRDCLRAGMRTFGNKEVFDKCVLTEEADANERQNVSFFPRDTVVVVWHLRLGDVAPHKPGDEFFKRVISALKEITRGGHVNHLRILLVGGGKGLQGVPSEYVQRLQDIVGADDGRGVTGHATFSVQAFADGSFEQQFVAMMQADVLIGSGSSVPQVAALLSGRPLFFSHVPKHGYGVGMEATADTVDMDESGQVLDSLRRVRLMLFEKMVADEGGPCRQRRRKGRRR